MIVPRRTAKKQSPRKTRKGEAAGATARGASWGKGGREEGEVTPARGARGSRGLVLRAHVLRSAVQVSGPACRRKGGIARQVDIHCLAATIRLPGVGATGLSQREQERSDG